MLSLDRLYQADAEDGSLELLAQGVLPLELVALAKALAHWLTSGLVLVLASPLLALLLQLPAEALGVLALALLLGTPTLTLIGGIGAALLIGARRGSVLLALLVLPLYIPVLIFGVGAVEGEVMGLSGRPAAADPRRACCSPPWRSPPSPPPPRCAWRWNREAATDEQPTHWRPRGKTPTETIRWESRGRRHAPSTRGSGIQAETVGERASAKAGAFVDARRGRSSRSPGPDRRAEQEVVAARR